MSTKPNVIAKELLALAQKLVAGPKETVSAFEDLTREEIDIILKAMTRASNSIGKGSADSGNFAPYAAELIRDDLGPNHPVSKELMAAHDQVKDIESECLNKIHLAKNKFNIKMKEFKNLLLDSKDSRKYTKLPPSKRLKQLT